MNSSQRVAYLQLHSAPMMNPGEPPSAALQAALKECGEKLKLRIWTAPVKDGLRRRWSQHRLFLATPDFRRDDDRIERVCEGVLLLADVFYGPSHDLLCPELALPFPWVTRIEKCVSKHELVTRISSLRNPREFPPTPSVVGGYTVIEDGTLVLAWRCVPSLDRAPTLRMACAFMVEAQSQFHVFPGGLEDAFDRGELIPRRAAQLARWESAFQNAYKAIEAVIGDPPKSDDRFRIKLKTIGIDPEEEVGYSIKEPIRTVIRHMNELRDKRVAHGSTRMRGIKLYQMIEFQQCASYVVQSAISKVTPDAFEGWSNPAAA